jgi:hypothetical protein
MDKSIICGCGSNRFWFFIDYVRCPECYSEYKIVLNFLNKGILFFRIFDKENKMYGRWIEKEL